MIRNPFEQASPVSRRLKVGFYGPSGSGKTFAALTFPRVAVVDAEGGTDLYAGRTGIPPFQVMRSKTLTELRETIAWVRADQGKSLDTLVIDPITVFYDVHKEAIVRSTRTGEMAFRDWNKVNSAMKALYNELTSLPVHVVVIAREATEYEGTGNDLRKVGVKADADRSMVYMLDFVLRFQPDHSALVVKSRGLELGERQRLAKVEWSVFAPLAATIEQGKPVEQQGEAEAAEAERLALEFQDREIVTSFFTRWRDQALSDADILTALKVTKAGEWRLGVKAADEAVAALARAPRAG